MNKVPVSPGWFSGWLLLLGVAILVISGCASKPTPDWHQRIGHYTYEQAVLELGPPFASTRLQDGTTVAERFCVGTRIRRDAKWDFPDAKW